MLQGLQLLGSVVKRGELIAVQLAEPITPKHGLYLFAAELADPKLPHGLRLEQALAWQPARLRPETAAGLIQGPGGLAAPRAVGNPSDHATQKRDQAQALTRNRGGFLLHRCRLYRL